MKIRELIKQLLEMDMDYQVFAVSPEDEDTCPVDAVAVNDTQKEVYIKVDADSI
jgi:hypothetical protein